MPLHPPPLKAHLRRDCAHAAASIPLHVNLTDTDPAVAGSLAVGPDAPTLGGLPEAALEERRAKRESAGPPAERPTRPIAAVPRQPDPEPAPPSRELALSIAYGYTAGHVPAGRAASEALARFIRAQPDYVAAIRAMADAELVAQRAVDAGDPAELRRALGSYADAKFRLVMLADVPSPLGDLSGAFQGLIDEWVLGTVVVGRMRRRSEAPPVVALDRVDNAERELGRVSALDDRFRAELESSIAGRRLADVLQLDAPTAANVTDLEILDLARSCGDGTATDALARGTCILALGIGGPIPPSVVLVRGQTRDEMVARARAWCAAKIHERAQSVALGAALSANPDPIDGPERYRAPRPAPITIDRNRSRRAREQVGLSLGQAAKHLGMSANEIEIIEASDDLGRHAQACDFEPDLERMGKLYMVSPEWMRGDVPLRDYVNVDAIRGSDKLTPGERDMVAEFAASLPRNSKTASERLATAELLHHDPLARIWTPGGDGSCRVCGLFESWHETIDSTRRCPAEPPVARIFTPRDDGSCAVSGEPIAKHDVDVDDGCSVAGARSCPAVAP